LCSTRLWLLIFKGPAGQTKSRQVWRLFGLLAAILQIERDPPTASELSKLKYQKLLAAIMIMAGSIAHRSGLVTP